MTAAAVDRADGAGIHLRRRSHGDLAAAVGQLADRDAHDHAIRPAGQTGNVVTVVLRRLQSIDERARDDRDGDLTAAEKAHSGIDMPDERHARAGDLAEKLHTHLAVVGAELEQARRRAHPIATAVSETSGFSLALCVASVIGGAMFGDNLSFISDTTIAACNGQGCAMKDKFRENFGIALPAAIASLALILVVSFHQDPGAAIIKPYNLIQLIPYLLVLAGGIAGIQVFVVLLVGIVSGAIIMLGSGQTTPWEMLTNMGSGTSGMFETSMVAILVAAMCALIRENGGFDVLLNVIHRIFRGKRGGQFGVGLLVTLLDIATANNTVAIVMANPIAKEISEDYGISARKTASLLDTFSCISQGILPYGAQMLVALSAVHELGYELSAFEVMPLLFYPSMLFISSLICIFLLPERGDRVKAKK